MKSHLGRLFFGVGLITMIFASTFELKFGSGGQNIVLGAIIGIVFTILSSITEW